MREGCEEDVGDTGVDGDAGRPEELGWVFVDDGDDGDDTISSPRDAAKETNGDEQDEWAAQLQAMRNLETARQQTQRDRYVDGIVGMASRLDLEVDLDGDQEEDEEEGEDMESME
ncbi:hypothetical protein IQ07DRAFT_586549 [Pyrenochaeta sp. DS3sAY3a]|nr:hypothetical protein IQ07DRAFT_586549 [Pyrenochaeta sp. DS3sAY3a]